MLLVNNLFVYGTLLFSKVWNQIVGHHAVQKPAYAVGWKRVYIKGQLYPGIISTSGSRVSGALVTNLSVQDWYQLDNFEDAIYTKKLLDVIAADGNTIQAYAYVVELQHQEYLSDKTWDPLAFEEKQLDEFLQKLSMRKI